VISRARLTVSTPVTCLFAVERRNRLLKRLGRPIKEALGKTR